MQGIAPVRTEVDSCDGAECCAERPCGGGDVCRLGACVAGAGVGWVGTACLDDPD